MKHNVLKLKEGTEDLNAKKSKSAKKNILVSFEKYKYRDQKKVRYFTAKKNIISKFFLN